MPRVFLNRVAIRGYLRLRGLGNAPKTVLGGGKPDWGATLCALAFPSIKVVRGCLLPVFPNICLAISVNFFPGWLLWGTAADNWSVGRCGRCHRGSARIVRELQVAAMSTSPSRDGGLDTYEKHLWRKLSRARLTSMDCSLSRDARAGAI